LKLTHKLKIVIPRLLVIDERQNALERLPADALAFAER
jgi:hypothetical protein